MRNDVWKRTESLPEIPRRNLVSNHILFLVSCWHYAKCSGNKFSIVESPLKSISLYDSYAT